MELNLPIKYNVDIDKSLGYRWIITINELDNGRLTGRFMSEPYDPIRGNIDELNNRFISRINDDGFEYTISAKEHIDIANVVEYVVSSENTRQLNIIMGVLNQFHDDMLKLDSIIIKLDALASMIDDIDDSHISKIMIRLEYLIDIISNYVNRSIMDKIPSIFRRKK